MKRAVILFAEGYETVEALLVVDLLRRGGVEVTMASITEDEFVRSSHGVNVEMDAVLGEVDVLDYDAIILPGGMPGTINLGADATVVDTIKKFAAEGKLVAAICAAPSVLGENHILEGKKATCHPGFEDNLLGATWIEQPVVVDGNVITSRGMGTAIAFALEIVRYFKDDEAVDHIRQGLVY